MVSFFSLLDTLNTKVIYYFTENLELWYNFCLFLKEIFVLTEIPMPSSSPKATEMKSNGNKEGLNSFSIIFFIFLVTEVKKFQTF